MTTTTQQTPAAPPAPALSFSESQRIAIVIMAGLPALRAAVRELNTEWGAVASLAIMATQPGRAITICKLATASNVSPAAGSMLADSLVRKGYATRISAGQEDDRRLVTVTMTAAGMQLMQRLAGEVSRQLRHLEAATMGRNGAKNAPATPRDPAPAACGGDHGGSGVAHAQRGV